MRVAWHNTPSISSSSPVSRYLGSGSFQRRQRQPDFIVATGGGKAREPDRESFFYPCSPKNLPKETPFLRPTTFKLFPLSPSLSPKKEPLFDARKSRANIRDGFSPVKSASRFFPKISLFGSSLLFPVRNSPSFPSLPPSLLLFFLVLQCFSRPP